MNTWKKSVVSWICGDTFYVSVPFTWLLGDAEAAATQYRSKHARATVVAGGPGVALAGAPWADRVEPDCPFDVLAMHNPCATFTTRGCPNHCRFCAVPRIEGDFRELDTWRPAPLLCDNNLLASSATHFRRVIESLRPFPACDFNQGLDARLFTGWHAGLIATLRRPMVRFSFDHISMEGHVADAIARARAAGLHRIGVYVLVGYDDTPADAEYRMEWVRGFGIRPNPMRYQPLDAITKNAYVGPGWTDRELKRMHRYYSRLRFLEHIPFREYVYTGDGEMPLLDNLPLLAEKEPR